MLIIEIIKNLHKILDSELIIIGLYPPPRGGIGIHIERLSHILKSNDIKYHIYNHGYYHNEYVSATKKTYHWWILFLIFCLYYRKTIKNKGIIFHFHIFSYLQYLFITLFSNSISKKIIITIHNENYYKYSFIKKVLFIKSIQYSKLLKVISVSKKLSDYLMTKSIDSIFLNAYIKSDFAEIKIKKKANIIYLVSNMWRFNHEQIYRYGIDLLFNLLNEYPSLYILHIYVSDINNSITLESAIKKYKLKNINSVEIFYSQNLIEYIKNYKLLIRPNRSDGFGVSVVEALNAGIPVIASDTCIRAPGAILFTSGNYLSLREQVNNIINKNYFVEFQKIFDNGNLLSDLYKSFLHNETGNTKL